MAHLPDEPLISVVTPAYNGAAYLVDLIESVRAQDWPRVEHIVIDDGSKDGGATVELLGRFPHLRWWTRENRGQYATLNEGIQAATGDVLTIISADDRFVTPSAFRRAIEVLRGRREIGMVYGRVLHIDPANNPLPFETSVEPRGPFSSWMLRHRSCIYHCSMFVERRPVAEAGILFDPSFRYLGDWDWISRVLGTGVKATYLDEPLSEYRDHPEQVTAGTRDDVWKGEARRICARNGASFAVCLALRGLYRNRHRLHRLRWLLKTGGPGLVARRLVHKLRG